MSGAPQPSETGAMLVQFFTNVAAPDPFLSLRNGTVPLALPSCNEKFRNGAKDWMFLRAESAERPFSRHDWKDVALWLSA